MKDKNTKELDLSFASLRSLIWRNMWKYLFADSLRVISSMSMAFFPLLFGILATSAGNKQQAFKMLVCILLVNFFHLVTWHIGDYFFVAKIIPISYEYKKIAFAIFWDKSYSIFMEKPSGKVGYYVNQLRSNIRDIYDSYHYGFLPVIGSIPVYIALFFKVTWQNSVIYSLFLIVAFIALATLTKPITKFQRRETDSESTNSGRIFDSYANFVNVFSFHSQEKEIKRNNLQVADLTKKTSQASYRLMNYWTVAASLIRVALWTIILFYSWYMYDTGQISFEAFIVSCTVLFDFTNQYWNLVHNIGNWNRNVSTFRESYTYLFPKQNIVKDFYNSQRLFENRNNLRLKDKLEISNLYFSYPDTPEQLILKNINITVCKNEKIGIVGKSGSGKSTLIKLLLGFYPHQDGEILVDGSRVDSDDLAQLYAYVPQDTTLFQESIYYNLAYARKGTVTNQEVIDAAEKAHISEFIESLPNGYSTLVGERGIKLSLGQRQRIAIARAFLKQSDLLILDEATSSLDSRTESYVQESFEKLWGNKSVIAIAHRLSTLNNVDRIIVMSKGEIVEQGTKDELLALDGHFSDLWNHQKKGMI